MPGYQDFMLPLLQLAADGREHSVREAMDTFATHMGITDTEQNELLPSGTQTKLHNRVSWAASYLNNSLLLERPRRGRYRITQRGLDVLRRKPQRIDNAFLNQFEEYRSFKTRRVDPVPDTIAPTVDPVIDEATPDERLEGAYKELRESLAEDLIRRVRANDSKFFEHLVVDLLVAMGYGGSRADAAQVVGRSGDDGIDGVIKEDRLGLDTVYIQAKKWENSVGPGEIDRFIGSLNRKKAHKGVFITSGTFTEGARRAGQEAHVRIVLIDGDQLAELMIDSGLGVTASKQYVVKKLDSDYFDV